MTSMDVVVVATWAFGEAGVTAAAEVLEANGTALDAVEEGIRTVEIDESVTSVGFGGLPNCSGVMQLDAAIMEASSGRCGSVAALEQCRSAISVARAVMESSRHAMLVGTGATEFARTSGLTVRDGEPLLSEHTMQRYREYLQGQEGPLESPSDTFGIICRDRDERIAVGVATSGMQFKEIGRVGDSPLIGNGLYAGAAGAACASGDGDQMIRKRAMPRFAEYNPQIQHAKLRLLRW